jgi:tetratricopeptide (TPR) repeat protein
MGKKLDQSILLFGLSRYEEAGNRIKEELANDPGVSKNHLILGVCLLFEEKYQEAEAELKESISLDPEEYEPYYFLAISSVAQKLFLRSKYYIEIAIRLSPNDASLYATQSEIYSFLEDYDLALESANKGLENDPTNVGCLQSKALYLLILDKIDEALDVIKIALLESPDNALTQGIYGCILYNKKYYKKALLAVQESLRLDPQNTAFSEILSNLLEVNHWIYRIWSRLKLASEKTPLGIILVLYAASFFCGANPSLVPITSGIQIFLLTIFSRNLIYLEILQPLIKISLRSSIVGRSSISHKEGLKAIISILKTLVFFLVFAWILSPILNLNVLSIVVIIFGNILLSSEYFSENISRVISYSIVLLILFLSYLSYQTSAFTESQRFVFLILIILSVVHFFREYSGCQRILRIVGILGMGGIFSFLSWSYPLVFQDRSNAISQNGLNTSPYGPPSPEEVRLELEEQNRSKGILNLTSFILEITKTDFGCNLPRHGLLEDENARKIFSNLSEAETQQFAKVVILKCQNTPASKAAVSQEKKRLKTKLDRINKRLFKDVESFFDSFIARTY